MLFGQRKEGHKDKLGCGQEDREHGQTISGWREGARDPLEMFPGMKPAAVLTPSSSAFAFQCCSPESWVSPCGPFPQQNLLAKEPPWEGLGFGWLFTILWPFIWVDRAQNGARELWDQGLHWAWDMSCPMERNGDQ